VLTQLANKIRLSHAVLDPQAIANSLYGCQRLSSESLEVKTLLSTLASKMEHCWKSFSSYQITYCLYGLQRMTINSSEMKALLKVLSQKITSCSDDFSSKQLALCFYGLQNMITDPTSFSSSSSSKEKEKEGGSEVSSIVTALMDKLSSSNDVNGWKDAATLSLLLFGLQGMTNNREDNPSVVKIQQNKEKEGEVGTVATQEGNSEIVSRLLKVLNEKLSSCLSTGVGGMVDFDPYSLGNAIYGLQRMKPSTELSKLLSFLLPSFEKILSSSQVEVITPAIISNMMFGLQGKTVTDQSIKQLLTGLYNITR
jgi:hypothetical protein